ncbi:MAG: pirin [Acinetobacter sp. GWC1_38_13]|uniref:Pirin family protein n=1 Tax=Acinetobacter junii TaxID=40215 RepID=A0AAW5RF43_ACIJU|nr:MULTISPECIES: pirin family protein [Acinetobacter]MBY3624103.1 pirin family protein [Acinetobacter sp. CUI P1]MCU4398069.1 pirin family protein [Acinetobacter junii]MCU4407622.1 pirin family protein [Acinetobacter junii]MDH0667243.1 pirin family protein [Acinetobacter junii]MDH0718369.1 pirin family protein [Acinetobacter junii]
MKSLAFIHRNDTRFAIGDFYPALSVFSYHELGNTTSPFLLLDHLGPGKLEPKSKKKGVNEHPHRGFETVTFVFAGELQHKDSTGGGGLIKRGDVQWMTAASGIQHIEQFSSEFRESGGPFEMVQLWVNLPAKDKMSTPRYQSLLNEDIPKIILDDQASYIRVVAGELNQTTGIAKTFTAMNVFDIHLVKDQQITLPAAEGATTLIYLRKGKVQFSSDEESLEEQALAVMSSLGTGVQINALENCDLLFLSAQPLNEPINGQGPFVMNSYDEILQAYDDIKTGKFGHYSD